MDEIDRRIIRRLQWPNSDTEFSFSDFAVSRSTGVSVQTVRKRIARMVENGILKGNYLMPMPSLFGLSSGTLVCSYSKEVAERPWDYLNAVPALSSVHTAQTPPMAIMEVMPRIGEEKATVREVESLGVRVESQLWHYHEPVQLSRRECLVLSRLMENHRMSLRELSERTGISTKSVSRIMRGLISRNCFTIEVAIDSRAVDHGTLFILQATVMPGRASQVITRVASKLGDRMMGFRYLSDDTILFLAWAENTMRVMEAGRFVESMREVALSITVRDFQTTVRYPDTLMEALKGVAEKN